MFPRAVPQICRLYVLMANIQTITEQEYYLYISYYLLIPVSDTNAQDEIHEYTQIMEQKLQRLKGTWFC